MKEDHYSWSRRWFPFDASRPPVNGYLDDIATGSIRRRPYHLLSDLTDVPCLVLLGQAGMGKTHEARQAVDALREQGELGDLLNIGRESNPTAVLSQLLKSDHCRSYRDGRVWHIFLDGLDEVPGPPGRLIAAIDDFVEQLWGGKGGERLRLRFLCRPTAWSDAFDVMVEGRWREDQLQKLELGPLDKSEVREAATAVLPGRADSFIESITNNDAEALAASPMLFRLLIDIFSARDSFPTGRVALYRLGLEQLIGPADGVAQLGVRAQTKRRLLVASRIAAAMSFSGLSRITVDQDTPDHEAVRLTDLAGGPEPAGTGNLPVTASELRAVLASRLFVRNAPNMFEWYHRTFMEFLTAHYLTVRRVPALDMWGLLHIHDPDGEGGIAPQLREVAAWLASMTPDFFKLMIDKEPEVLLRSDVAAASPQDRSRLVDALLNRLATGQLVDVYRALFPYLGKLAHPDLSAQLEERLKDRSQGYVARRVAIKIAQETELRNLLPSLIAVAQDTTEEIDIRRAAISAVGHFGAAEDRAQLVPILASDLSVDVSDELKGAVLRATWPDQLSVPALLDALASRKNTGLIGTYYMFLYQLDLGSWSPEDALAGIAWLERWFSIEDVGEWELEANRLCPRIFWASAALIRYQEVRLQLARLVAKQFRNVTRYVLHTTKSDSGTWPRETAPRLALVLDILSYTSEPQRLAESLQFHSGELIRVDDLDAYLDAIATNDRPKLKPAIATIITNLSRRVPLDRLERVWLTADHETTLKDTLRGAYAVDLTSPEAEWMRSAWEEERKKAKVTDTAPEAPQRAEQIGDLLNRIESGEPSLWWQLNLHLFMAEDGRYQGEFEFRGDLRETPGWKALSQRDRMRVVIGAKDYLTRATLSDLTWLGTNTSLRPASAGFRALHLLFDEDDAALDALDFATWRRWAPTTISFIDNNYYSDGSAQKRLLTMAYQRAPGAVLGAIARIALGPKSRGLGERELDLLGTIADERLNALLAKLAERDNLKGDGARGRLYGFLASMGDSETIEKVRVALERAPSQAQEGSSDQSWIVEAAVQLLRQSPAEIWFELLDLTDRNAELARKIWSDYADGGTADGGDPLDTVGAFGLAQAYVKLTRLVPEKPVETGRFRLLSAVDDIDQLKSVLLRRLTASGTHEALEQLVWINNKIEDVDLKWHIEEARQNYRQKTLPLHSPAEALTEISTLGAPLDKTKAEWPVPPEKSTGEMGVDAVPIEPRFAAPEIQPSGPLPTTERLNFLSFATEWASGHGGISTLNRELCIALAALGHGVWCVVPDASTTEIEDARAKGVILRGCPSRPGIADNYRLLLLQRADFEETAFDVVLGHDHITGPFASHYGEQFGAQYVHFVHTVPLETEGLKTRNNGNGRLLKGNDKYQEQIKLCRTAQLIVAIGPKIYSYAQLELDDGPPKHLMMPGLNVELLAHRPDLSRLARNHCLLSGRMEDASVKGVGLGCEAVLVARAAHWKEASKRPKLVVRGFDKDNADDEFAAVVGAEKFAEVVLAKPYTSNREEVLRDITHTSLLLMPSLSEGFGLTAYEAIAAGVPTLISDESGLAEYLQMAVSDEIINVSVAEEMILPAQGPDASQIWAARIYELLSDKPLAFANAEKLRTDLKPILSWENAARSLTSAIQSPAPYATGTQPLDRG